MTMNLRRNLATATLFAAVLCVLLYANNANAVTYNPADPSMAHMELAAAPRLLGPTDDHPGMWEYVYDFYHAAGTWEKFITLGGFEADSTVNLHDVGSGLGLYQRWDTHTSGGWQFWAGYWDKGIRPSYVGTSGGKFNQWDLPSDGACVGCANEAYEYYNEWHTPYDYNGSIFYGGAKGVLEEHDVGITGNDAITFHVWNPGGPNQYGIGGLGLTFRVVHPNAPGSITWNTYHWNGNPLSGTVTGPAPIPCIVGDANCDGYVDISGDILPGFSNFTGPGSFGKTRAQGDVQDDTNGATNNLDPHDGDVDVSDLITMFGAFTGPPPDEGAPNEAGGLAAAEAGDPGTPDLIYDSATGEVVLDVDGSGIIGYVLKSAGGMIPGNHTPILAGVTTSTVNEISEAAFASSVGANSIGMVFPTGMDLAALTAFLTTNQVSTSLGAPVVPFELVVLSAGPAVPESATVVLAIFGLAGMGLVALRRRKAA